MAFYVPVGPRGIVLRVGCMMIGVFGSVSYWRASRRRSYPPHTLAFDLDWNDV